MPLTPDTESYQSILSDTAGMTAAEVGNYFEKNKIDKEEFKAAFKRDKKQQWAEESLDSPSPIRGVETTYPEEEEGVRTASGKEPGILPTRLAGRAIGDIGRGIIRIADAALPEVITNDIERIAKFTGGYVPEEVKTFAGQVFNPYQGSGPVEPIVGDMISLVLGRGLIGKAGKFAKTGMPYKTGRQAVRLRTTTPKIKGLITPRKARRKRLKGVRREALGWGGSATIVFGPEEDMLTELMEEFPETFEIFNGLAINPDDPKLLQEANALLNNLIIEGSIGGTYLFTRPHVRRLAQKARLMSKSKVNVQQTKLSKIHQWARRNMTSRFGIDDTMLAAGLRRIYAGNKAVSEADGISQDLVRTVKKEARAAGVSAKSVEDLMNSALGGTGATKQEIEAVMQRSINTLNEKGFTETTALLGRMRNIIDELSAELTKRGGLVRSDLKATMDAQQGIYLNRAYRLFDDPSFKGWDSLSDEVKEGAITYLKRMGVEEDEIEFTLKQILSKESEGGFIKGMKFLGDVSQKSNKAFLARDDIPPAIRSLMGEIKDPYKNFARTYEKLSIARAESDFLKGVRNHLISNNLAVEGRPVLHRISQGPEWRLPEGELDRGLVNLQKITDERLARIIGEGNVKTGKGVNPLKNLFVDKNYYTFLEEGIDLLHPSGPILKAFFKAKTLTQTAKTVMSPATHFRNVFGNMILMIANGYNPITGGGGAAFNIVKKRLRGLSSEEFGQQIGRYQELGIMDSSVKAQTVKELASEAFRFEPGSWAAQVMETKAGKVTKKAFETYQAEDDFFKIMHFEKTKKQMRKWLPDIPERELEELAAARTRDLMPNYALVPKTVKLLRKSPVSDFAAWPAEVTRVSKNLMKYTWDDWMGNTVRDLRAKGYNISDKGAATLKSQALGRAGYLSAAAMGGDIAMQWSMNIMGLGAEDVYDINRLSPSWSQDTAKIFLSPINQDKNKHIGVDFINIGPIDPFSYLKAPARMLVSHMLSDKNLEDSDYNKIGYAMYNNLAGPFLDASMVTEAAVSGGMTPITPEGRRQIIDDPGKYVDRLYKTVAKPFIPGFGIMGEKQVDFWNARAARQKLGGEGAMSRYGYTLPEVEFTGPGMVARWAGIRPQRLDISAGLRRNLLPLIKEIDNSSARFTDVISNPQGVSRKDAMKAYQDAQLYRLEQFQKLRSMTDTYDHLLRDANLRKVKFRDKTDAIWQGITKNEALKMNPNLFNYMDWSRKNHFIPFYPSDTAEMLVQQHSFADVPWEDLYNFSRYLEGKTISD
jgi:hypothetical protein